MKYTFRSRKTPRYTFALSYVKGVLKVVHFDFGQAFEDGWFTRITECISYSSLEASKAKLDVLGFEMTDEPKAATDGNAAWKVTLWLACWKEYKKQDYQMKAADAAKLQRMAYTKEDYQAMMRYYFEGDDWFSRTETPGGFVAHANTLLSLIRQTGKRKYPDRYDRALEAKLKGQELSEYWKHLRDIGYKPKKNHAGRTVDWVRESSTIQEAASQAIEDLSKPN